jgi:hypothetical protein
LLTVTAGSITLRGAPGLPPQQRHARPSRPDWAHRRFARHGGDPCACSWARPGPARKRSRPEKWPGSRLEKRHCPENGQAWSRPCPEHGPVRNTWRSTGQREKCPGPECGPDSPERENDRPRARPSGPWVAGPLTPSLASSQRAEKHRAAPHRAAASSRRLGAAQAVASAGPADGPRGCAPGDSRSEPARSARVGAGCRSAAGSGRDAAHRHLHPTALASIHQRGTGMPLWLLNRVLGIQYLDPWRACTLFLLLRRLSAEETMSTRLTHDLGCNWTDEFPRRLL